MQTEKYPLPFGWIKESDQASGRTFYVRPFSAVSRLIGH